MARKELANALAVTYDALSKYETDERQVDHELLIKMADFFGVTTDFFLGRQTEIVAEEGLLYGLDENEREIIRRQADFLRYEKKLSPDARGRSSGSQDTEENGGKIRYKKGS